MNTKRLKHFDLESAKAGAKVVTQDGVTYQGRYVWAGKGEIRTQAFGRFSDAESQLLDMILDECKR